MIWKSQRVTQKNQHRVATNNRMEISRRHRSSSSSRSSLCERELDGRLAAAATTTKNKVGNFA
jgi:hypothetical protein